MALVRRLRAWWLFPALALLAAGCYWPRPSPPYEGSRDFLFCFWNVENLFDDQDDSRTQAGDREYDGWFAHDPAALRLKLDHLSRALIDLNDGRGPDILAVAEVEGARAADLLRQALNARLDDPALQYQNLLVKELSAGRHIAPAIITRLPVLADRTRLHGRRQRILEGHIEVDGHDLVVVASHWTSRVSDKSGRSRAKYGDQIYGLFRAMYRNNPAVDFLVCGDFNDPPNAPSVTEHLRAQPVPTGGPPPEGPHLFNLFADKDPRRYGTHYYGGHWYIFDQIVVSAGLLDEEGWSCDPDSVATVNTLVRPNDRQRRPWRFGNERDKSSRGYSDHFPVTVRLRVH
jgi:endonuclease/exonuclease/phosphatase family metal-dependent hydrolase